MAFGGLSIGGAAFYFWGTAAGDPSRTAGWPSAPDKARMPPALLSSEEHLFNCAFLLRAASDMQPLRFVDPVQAPRLLDIPQSVVWNKYLSISYATNKADAEFIGVPLPRLPHPAKRDEKNGGTGPAR